MKEDKTAKQILSDMEAEKIDVTEIKELFSEFENPKPILSPSLYSSVKTNKNPSSTPPVLIKSYASAVSSGFQEKIPLIPKKKPLEPKNPLPNNLYNKNDLNEITFVLKELRSIYVEKKDIKFEALSEMMNTYVLNSSIKDKFMPYLKNEILSILKKPRKNLEKIEQAHFICQTFKYAVKMKQKKSSEIRLNKILSDLNKYIELLSKHLTKKDNSEYK